MDTNSTERRATPIPPEMLRTTSKPAVKSKTVWGLVTAILGAVLVALGIDADPAFLSDGFQASEDLVAMIGLVLAIIGYALKEFGHRAAEGAISGIFRSKDAE